MKVELSKEECEFLSLAMTEAIQQADTAQASPETKAIRAVFVTIKMKMELAMKGYEQVENHD